MKTNLIRLCAARSRPHVGQYVTWVLLLVAVFEVYAGLPTGMKGERQSWATILYFVPADVLASAELFNIARAALCVFALLWAMQIWMPASSWMTAILFTGVVALYYENATKIHHVFHLSNIILIIHAVWYHFYHREIREALRAGAFWHRRLYPGWAFQSSVWCIAIYHTWAGISKVSESGWGWADGTSLQIWTHLREYRSTMFREMILGNRLFAQSLQVCTMVVEVFAITAVCSRYLKWGIGAGLIGLYIGIIRTFGYQFEYNAFLVAAFLLPTKESLRWTYRQMRRRIRIQVHVNDESRIGRALRPVLARVDHFGIVEMRNRVAASQPN